MSKSAIIDPPKGETRNTKKRESGDLVALNFKVSPELKREIKMWAAEHEMTQRDVLEKGFDLLRKHFSQ